MRAWVLAALPAMVMSAPVLAGSVDPAPTEPIVVQQSAPVFSGTDWTGFYAGGQLGFGNVDTSGAATVDGDGGFGGLHAGYNWDFGTTVIGAEIDYDVTEFDLDAGAGSVDDVTRLKLRAGWENGATLFYGTLGAALASAEIGGLDYDDTGVLLGGGVAYDMGNNWVLGGEVLYHQFDDFDGTGIDVDVTTVSARVSYRF